MFHVKSDKVALTMVWENSFFFLFFSGVFLDGWFSARAKIVGTLPLIRVHNTFVLGYCSYFGLHMVSNSPIFLKSDFVLRNLALYMFVENLPLAQ
jgi:hypothetical protein